MQTTEKITARFTEHGVLTIDGHDPIHLDLRNPVGETFEPFVLANARVRDLGYEFAYGWHDGLNGGWYAPLVYADEHTEVWD